MTAPHEHPTVYASVARRLADLWTERAAGLGVRPASEWCQGAQVALAGCADELRAMADQAEARWAS